MAGKGGGAWKVAYADFVTAMMAFFLVMWIVAQNKPVKEAIAGYFRDPFGQHGEGAPLSGPVTDLEEFGGWNGPDPEGRSIQRSHLKLTGAGKEPEIATIIEFEADSAALDAEAEIKLGELVVLLMGKRNKIEIRAFTPVESDQQERNRAAWELSFARGQATLNYLISQGIGIERLRLCQASLSEPLGSSGPPSIRSRSVEVYALNEFVETFSDETAAPAKPAPSTPASSKPAAKSNSKHGH